MQVVKVIPGIPEGVVGAPLPVHFPGNILQGGLKLGLNAVEIGSLLGSAKALGSKYVRVLTGEAARSRVHQDRHRYAAIMVGVGTVLADDPLLTCRMEGGRNPVRVICDTHLRTPLESQIVRTAGEIPTILAVGEAASAQAAPYRDAGCQVWVLPERDGHVDLSALMERLGAAEIDSVLLEGGGTLNWAALESGIVQRVQAYIAPKLFGGRDAKSPVAGLGVELPAQAVGLKNITVTPIGEDFLLESEVDTDVHRNR